MKQADVANLAWDLAYTVSPSLERGSRTALFAALGAGESNAVIEKLLTECRRTRMELSDDLTSRLRIWADAYRLD